MNGTAVYRMRHYLLLLLMMAVMLVPVVATLMYALADNWSRSVLPQGWTWQWLADIWQQPRYLKALATSLLLSLGAALFSMAVVLPVVLAVHTRHPRWEAWVAPVLVLPFTLPPVVASVGMLQLYAGYLGSRTGTWLVLVGCYFTIVLPFVYRALDNHLRAIGVKELLETATLLGASRYQLWCWVLLPNLQRGLLVALLISLAFLMGEFVFVNMLAGAHVETVQVFLYSLKNQSGHLSSAVVISYFALIIVISALLGRLTRERT